MMVETSSLRKAAMPVLVVLALSAARACLNSPPLWTSRARCVTPCSPPPRSALHELGLAATQLQAGFAASLLELWHRQLAEVPAAVVRL